jgi:hypothetical protein
LTVAAPATVFLFLLGAAVLALVLQPSSIHTIRA